MKPGSRALGIAESYTGDVSTLAGVVMTAGGRIDGLVFGTCTVGGTDATDAIIDLVDRLDREDIRVVLIAGVALAWYNIVDLDRVEGAVGAPVVAVTFEASDGLETAIESAFDGPAQDDRLRRYRALPSRTTVQLDGGRCFARSIGLTTEEAAEVVAAFTAEGEPRPEPLRVANIAARAADERCA